MRYIDLIESFRTKRIVILGDAMLDTYWYGTADRISSEAPVPVVRKSRVVQKPGGAANVAMNVRALGSECTLIGIIGGDIQGEILQAALVRSGITSHLHRVAGRPTTEKIRVVSQNVQMLRVDTEVSEDLSDTESSPLLDILHEVLKGADALILEDYDLGVLSPKVIAEAIGMAKRLNVPIAVDPKHRHILAYRGVDLLKPNLKELSTALFRQIDRDETSLQTAMAELYKILQPDLLLTTLGEGGMRWKKGEEAGHVQAHHRQVYDVSGAGDTVISVATLALCSGATPEEITRLANLAGGMACEVSGVAVISAEELIAEVRRQEI